MPDDGAVCDAGPEGFGSGADTLGLHHRGAVRAEVIDPRSFDAFDRVAARCEGDNQQIEHKSRVDASTQD